MINIEYIIADENSNKSKIYAYIVFLTLYIGEKIKRVTKKKKRLEFIKLDAIIFLAV